MALKLIQGPDSEPITLDEAKLHCRVDGADDDALFTTLITAARLAAENETGRAFINQTWELALDRFPCEEIDIPLAPVASITSVKYTDVTGVLQTIDSANYLLDNYGIQHRVLPNYGYTWPTTRCINNAVLVRFVAGYGVDASFVPESIKVWIKMFVGTLYQNREAVINGTISTELARDYMAGLLDPFRVVRL